MADDLHPLLDLVMLQSSKGSWYVVMPCRLIMVDLQQIPVTMDPKLLRFFGDTG